jgi:hypothetical protein
MWTYNYTNELYHYGVPGMKWGERRRQDKGVGYKSTGVRAALARRSNKKVDKSFEKWKENDNKRNNAIDLGKTANAAKIAYERDKSNVDLKTAYKTANKQYKKALSENTTYRKGAVRQEVGKDISRKYLSEAKKTKKQLANDPSNKELQKQYDKLMSKHDVERAKARRAADVGSKRSQKIASIKRGMTIAITTAAGTAAAAAGAYAVNRYLNNHNVTLNGKRIQFSAQNISNIGEYVKKARDVAGFFY